MTERKARGLKGMLCFGFGIAKVWEKKTKRWKMIMIQRPFLRVYADDRMSFTDYGIDHQDLDIKITDKTAVVVKKRKTWVIDYKMPGYPK